MRAVPAVLAILLLSVSSTAGALTSGAGSVGDCNGNPARCTAVIVAGGRVHTVALKSDGRYGFDPNVWAGMPVKTTSPGAFEVITSYDMDDFAKSKIKITNDELVSERDTVKEMLS